MSYRLIRELPLRDAARVSENTNSTTRSGDREANPSSIPPPKSTKKADTVEAEMVEGRCEGVEDSRIAPPTGHGEQVRHDDPATVGEAVYKTGIRRGPHCEAMENDQRDTVACVDGDLEISHRTGPSCVGLLRVART